jgi:hypothetical protein
MYSMVEASDMKKATLMVAAAKSNSWREAIGYAIDETSSY